MFVQRSEFNSGWRIALDKNYYLLLLLFPSTRVNVTGPCTRHSACRSVSREPAGHQRGVLPRSGHRQPRGMQATRHQQLLLPHLCLQALSAAPSLAASVAPPHVYRVFFRLGHAFRWSLRHLFCRGHASHALTSSGSLARSRLRRALTCVTLCGCRSDLLRRLSTLPCPVWSRLRAWTASLCPAGSHFQTLTMSHFLARSDFQASTTSPCLTRSPHQASTRHHGQLGHPFGCQLRHHD